MGEESNLVKGVKEFLLSKGFIEFEYARASEVNEEVLDEYERKDGDYDTTVIYFKRLESILKQIPRKDFLYLFYSTERLECDNCPFSNCTYDEDKEWDWELEDCVSGSLVFDLTNKEVWKDHKTVEEQYCFIQKDYITFEDDLKQVIEKHSFSYKKIDN